MRIHSEPEGNLEFQIAPMVDVIFILILFFMCSAGATKVENELSLKLPGRLSQDQPMRMLDEQIIEIEENGQIILNDSSKWILRPCARPFSATRQCLTTANPRP